MNNLKQLLLLVLFIVVSGNLIAQDLTLDGIRQAKMKNMNVIKDGEDVTGYFMFYEVDKRDRKTKNYLLQFLDQNLNKIASKRITGTPYLNLLDGQYNGETIMLKFVDLKEKLFIFKQYDKNAELIYTKKREVDKMELRYVASMIQKSTEPPTINFLPIDDLGFVNIAMKDNKKTGYQIEFFPKTKEVKGWKYNSSPTSKELEIATHLGSSEDVYLANIMKLPGMMKKDLKTYVLGIDAKTGDKLYEISLSDEEHNIFAFHSFFDKNTNNATLFGYYYDIADKAMSGKSKGLCAITVNKSGETLSKKFISWTEDVAKHLDVNKKGKIKGEGYVYFHKLIQTDDGKIYAVGEQFKQNANAAGIAAMALGAEGASLTKFVIQDLVIFEFNPEFELENTTFIEKGKNQFKAGLVMGSMQLIGYYLNSLGAFDYMFMQQEIEENLFTVLYTDYDREEKEWQVKTVTQVDGAYESDDISLESKAKYQTVLPAKDGYILIIEYFKKEKQLKGRLEKIDY